MEDGGDGSNDPYHIADFGDEVHPHPEVSIHLKSLLGIHKDVQDGTDDDDEQRSDDPGGWHRRVQELEVSICHGQRCQGLEDDDRLHVGVLQRLDVGEEIEDEHLKSSAPDDLHGDGIGNDPTSGSDHQKSVTRDLRYPDISTI